MADETTVPAWKRAFKEREFLAFSVLTFAAKSFLLVRLPYRDVDVNAIYTALILLSFYLYFRFRYKVKPPFLIVFFLAAAVAVDVAGNFFHLYGRQFGPVEYDEFSHMVGSGLSLPPAMWLLRATTRRFGVKLPLDMTAFLSVTITFSFCSYYEILELWDEVYFGGKRLWTPSDSANDLQWDLSGIIIAAFISIAVFRAIDRRAEYRAESSQALPLSQA